MARATMADLIQDLRELTDVGTAEFTIGTETYWSDDHLQAILDSNARVVRYQALRAIPTLMAGGVATYSEYWSGLGTWEDVPTVMDATYGTISAGSYTFDQDLGIVNFTVAGIAAVRLISGTIYNLNGAAADVWRRKSVRAAGAYDVSTDNHTLRRSQLVAQCNGMVRTFEMMRPSWEFGRGAEPGGSVYAERGDMGDDFE